MRIGRNRNRQLGLRVCNLIQGWALMVYRIVREKRRGVVRERGVGRRRGRVGGREVLGWVGLEEGKRN